MPAHPTWAGMAPWVYQRFVVPLLHDHSVTWTHLLPEAGAEPTGFVAPAEEPPTTTIWTGQPLPDPTTVGLQDAVNFARRIVFTRQPGAERAVRAWPAELRRLAALRVHISAVQNWIDDRSPDEGPARVMPLLIDDRMRWSRSDLAWALRTADGYGLYDGAAFLLPGYIAASLSGAQLAGFEGALRAVLGEFIDAPRVRKLLGDLYGPAIGRATDA